MILAGIKAELPEVESFTREDLLHLRVLAHVATITRYRYVCGGVRALVEGGQVVEKERRQLVLASRSKAFDRQTAGLPLWERYYDHITWLVSKQPAGTPFGVMDLVALWTKQDQHLTTNSKRIAVRDSMRQLVRDELVAADEMYSYRRLK